MGRLQAPAPPLGVTARYRNCTLEPDVSPVMLVFAWIVGGIATHWVFRRRHAWVCG